MTFSSNQKLNEEDLLKIDLPTNENCSQLLATRHSCAHVLAMSVQRLFPSAKVTIGPWIDNG
jgi:threonyl-tRNA synthetase